MPQTENMIPFYSVIPHYSKTFTSIKMWSIESLCLRWICIFQAMGTRLKYTSTTKRQETPCFLDYSSTDVKMFNSTSKSFRTYQGANVSIKHDNAYVNDRNRMIQSRSQVNTRLHFSLAAIKHEHVSMLCVPLTETNEAGVQETHWWEQCGVLEHHLSTGEPHEKQVS